MRKIFRIILKQTLSFLARLAIHKHNIRFIIIAGNYGTGFIREGIYDIVSEKFSARRNIQTVWWDLSIPLNILGYRDKRRTVLGWIKPITKSISTLLTGPVNPHWIILDLNFSDEDVVNYWDKIIKPEILVITSTKKTNEYLIDKLIKRTEADGGKIIVSNKVNIANKKKYVTYDFENKKIKLIKTTNNTYRIGNNWPVVFFEIYPPIVAVAEAVGFSEGEIYKTILNFDAGEKLVSKIKTTIKNESDLASKGETNV